MTRSFRLNQSRPEVLWGVDGPLVPDYAEQYHRILPQFEVERFTQWVQARLKD